MLGASISPILGGVDQVVKTTKGWWQTQFGAGVGVPNPSSDNANQGVKEAPTTSLRTGRRLPKDLVVPEKASEKRHVQGHSIVVFARHQGHYGFLSLNTEGISDLRWKPNSGTVAHLSVPLLKIIRLQQASPTAARASITVQADKWYVFCFTAASAREDQAAIFSALSDWLRVNGTSEGVAAARLTSPRFTEEQRAIQPSKALKIPGNTAKGKTTGTGIGPASFSHDTIDISGTEQHPKELAIRTSLSPLLNEQSHETSVILGTSIQPEAKQEHISRTRNSTPSTQPQARPIDSSESTTIGTAKPGKKLHGIWSCCACNCLKLQYLSYPRCFNCGHPRDTTCLAKDFTTPTYCTPFRPPPGPMVEGKPPFRYAAVLGDRKCGKSWLLSTWKNVKTPETPPHVSDNYTSPVIVPGIGRILLSCRDMDYRAARIVSGDANVALICFDVGSLQSLDNVIGQVSYQNSSPLTANVVSQALACLLIAVG
jgi:hypothetical protein